VTEVRQAERVTQTLPIYHRDVTSQTTSVEARTEGTQARLFSCAPLYMRLSGGQRSCLLSRLIDSAKFSCGMRLCR
jgi:hypothetical protein